MRYFIHLLLVLCLIGCSPKTRSNNSHIVVMDNMNSFVTHNTILFVEKKAVLKFIFHPYDSEGLYPRVYAAGYGKIKYTTRSPDNRIRPSVFYEIECIPETELVVLFIFEGNDRYGSKVLIRVLKIK